MKSAGAWETQKINLELHNALSRRGRGTERDRERDSVTARERERERETEREREREQGGAKERGKERVLSLLTELYGTHMDATHEVLKCSARGSYSLS